MKKSTFLSYCLFGLLLTSCVKDADVKIPKVETKLVLSSFICPQEEFVIVKVTTSKPIYNNPDNFMKHETVSDATVVISSSTDSWILPYNQQYRRYMLDSSLIHIKAGEKYSLSVSTPEGKFAEAITSIPYSNNTLTYTTSDDPESLLGKGYILKAEWQDTPNSSDYYMIETRHVSNSYLHSYWESISDEGNPGGILKTSVRFSYGNDATSPDTVYAMLSVISRDLHLYYQRFKGPGISSDDIFSEPLPAYTNIKGGLGLFAGFNKYEVRVFPK